MPMFRIFHLKLHFPTFGIFLFAVFLSGFQSAHSNSFRAAGGEDPAPRQLRPPSSPPRSPDQAARSTAFVQIANVSQKYIPKLNIRQSENKGVRILWSISLRMLYASFRLPCFFSSINLMLFFSLLQTLVVRHFEFLSVHVGVATCGGKIVILSPALSITKH